jgi:phasin family protein
MLRRTILLAPRSAGVYASFHAAVQQRHPAPSPDPIHPSQENVMTFTADQFVAAQKAQVETLFGLTSKAFEGVEKLVELNLQVAKTTLTEVADTTQAALSVKDAQELLALQAGLLQPLAEKTAAYSRHVYDILAGTNAEVTKVAEATVAESQKKVLALVDNAVKNAPAGTENAVALMKSAVAAANNAFESVQKASKQAAEVAEANFAAMANTAVKATQQAANTAPARGKRAA